MRVAGLALPRRDGPGERVDRVEVERQQVGRGRRARDLAAREVVGLGRDDVARLRRAARARGRRPSDGASAPRDRSDALPYVLRRLNPGLSVRVRRSGSSSRRARSSRYPRVRGRRCGRGRHGTRSCDSSNGRPSASTVLRAIETIGGGPSHAEHARGRRARADDLDPLLGLARQDAVDGLEQRVERAAERVVEQPGEAGGGSARARRRSARRRRAGCARSRRRPRRPGSRARRPSPRRPPPVGGREHARAALEALPPQVRGQSREAREVALDLALRDERAARAPGDAPHRARRLERIERCTQRRAADAVALGHVPLGSEALAREQRPARDLVEDAATDVVGGRPERGHGLHRLEGHQRLGQHLSAIDRQRLARDVRGLVAREEEAALPMSSTVPSRPCGTESSMALRYSVRAPRAPRSRRCRAAPRSW